MPRPRPWPPSRLVLAAPRARTSLAARRRPPLLAARHRPGVALRLALAGLVLTLCTAGISHAEPDVRLPPGTRSDAHGELVSGRGIRETTDFLARELSRRGIVVDQVGPYGARGAVVTRFISRTPSTPWRALHVLRTAGKTVIFFVPRAKSAATP